MKSVPFRRRLYVLVAAGFLPVAVASGVGLSALFQQQRHQAEHAALDITRALSSAMDAELRQAIAVLEVLASSASFDRKDPRAFRVRMERTAALHADDWLGLILYDRDGQEVINTNTPPGTEAGGVQDRRSFERLLAEQRPIVGQLRRDAGGSWGIPVRVPVIRQGQVDYVLTAVIRPNAFLAVVDRQRLARGWVVTGTDAFGRRVFRSPGQEQYVGTPVSGTLAAMMDTGEHEGKGLTTTSEGHEVYTAFSRSPETGWAVALGIPRDDVEAAAYRSAATFGGGIVLSLLAGLLTALLVARAISRPMHELRLAAREAGAGREPPGVATDVHEIQEVSLALADAARLRREAEAEREELLRRERIARNAAEGANRAKDEFLAMLGHELRNPLAAITNATALLGTPAADEASRDKARAVISRQASHLARMTDDLLDAGRAVLGKVELERQPVDLALVAHRAVEALHASRRDRFHDVVESNSSAWVDGDSVRLEQVIGNLLTNAIKYTPGGGRIRVSVRREGDEAVLRVADDGIGIPRELQERIFDLFVQGSRPLDRSSGGLGIGLTLVRRLVEAHGGRVEVASEGEGRGSEFVVRLPAVAAPVARPAEPAAGAPEPHRILLVEDNEDARETLETLLRLRGHEVASAADGPGGLMAALRQRPHVMLVDIGLPGMDGLEVARRVRADAGWAHRPLLVALTGYGQEEDRRQALEAGFDAHVTKPVDMDAIDRILAGRPATSAMPGPA